MKRGHGEADSLREYNHPHHKLIGSFIFAVVDGLFGLSWSEAGATIAWQPGFPQSWDHAELALPYARLTYHSENRGEQEVRRYQLDAPGGKKLAFTLDLPAGEVEQVLWNGQTQDFTCTTRVEQVRLTFRAPAVERHAVEVVFRPEANLAQPEVIHATLSPSAPVYSMAEPTVVSLLAQMQQETAQPVNLTALFNSSTLHVTSAWRLTAIICPALLKSAAFIEVVPASIPRNMAACPAPLQAVMNNVEVCFFSEVIR